MAPICGAAAGAIESPSKVIALGAVVIGLGAALNLAFRPSAGPLAETWRRIRATRSPELYRVYARAGPYAWRFGAACVSLALLRVTLP